VFEITETLGKKQSLALPYEGALAPTFLVTGRLP